jgi:hypothetical protein
VCVAWLEVLPLSCRPQKKDIYMSICEFEGRNSSVGIVTRYGLDGPGTESR